MVFFSGDYISALKGCCPFIFLHVLEIDPGYLAHPHLGQGSPPQKKMNGENLKFGIKFRVCAPITSGPVGISLRNFFHTTCREAGVIIWVQLLECPPPKYLEGKKNAQIWTRFLTTFDFGREYLRKGSTHRKSEKNTFNHNPFHVEQKHLVNFGPQTTEIQWSILTHPIDSFGETIFRPLRGAAPSNFYTC